MAIILVGKAALTGGVGIGGADRGVDRVDDPLPRPAVPIADAVGQRMVEVGEDFTVGEPDPCG